MKDTASEASMTVIALVLIGIVAAIATPLITNMMNTTEKKACCSTAGGTWSGNTCAAGGNNYYDQSTYDACIGEAKS